MHWLDIVFLVVLLIFGLIGLKKGFIGSLLQLFSVALTIVLVVFLAQPFTGFVDGIFGNGISTFFSEQMTGIVSSWGDAEQLAIPLTADTTASQVMAEYLPNLNGIVKSIVSALVGTDTIVANTNVLTYFSNRFGGFVTIVAGAVVLFLLIRIALGLLSKLFDRITENRGINGLDRVLGFVFGAIKGLFYISLIIVILKVLSVVGPINEFVVGWLDNTQVLQAYANWLYEQMDKLIATIDFNALFGDIFVR